MKHQGSGGRRAPFRGPAQLEVNGSLLEDKLQCKLNLSRRPRLEDLAKEGVRNQIPWVSREANELAFLGEGLEEIRSIQQIEELSPKLQVHSTVFSKVGIFQKREIEVRERRPAERVARKRPGVE